MKIVKIILFYTLAGLFLSYTINVFASVTYLSQCPQYQQLTFTQKAKVNEIINEFNKAIIPIEEQLRTNSMALEAQLNQAKINQQVVNNLVNRISSLHNQIFAEGIEMRIQLIKITSFNLALCTKPISQESCNGGICKQSINQVKGSQAGLQTSPKQGVQSNPKVSSSETKSKDNSKKYWW
ncbi:MAG: hypothetical protein AMJ43_02545 [Coxiella sp. DG_40]|nr:MAG: hypothetical protein AMJ43_02545 [Coxiella sp. DG_40]